MKALTCHQPWAWTIMQFEGKDIENRPWSTEHRGPFWVHASARPWGHEAQIAADWIESEIGMALPRPEQLLYGAILGSVELAGVCQNADEFSKWAIPGRYHWLLRHPEPLTQPIPDIKGHQRWWN